MLVMWSKVSGGPEPLWVKAEECRLINGELAFVNEAGLPPPLPEWFDCPAKSQLRRASEDRDRAMGFPLLEVRSMRAKAEDVLAFYEECMKRGGLVKKAAPHVDRVCSGFSMENEEYTFGIELYKRNDLVFWTIQHTDKIHTKKMEHKWMPHVLELLCRNSERVTLRRPRTDSEEIWAPVDALRTSQPPMEKRYTTREKSFSGGHRSRHGFSSISMRKFRAICISLSTRMVRKYGTRASVRHSGEILNPHLNLVWTTWMVMVSMQMELRDQSEVTMSQYCSGGTH